MNPDARGIALAPRHEPKKLLAETLAIFARAERLPHDQRRRNGDDRQIDDVQQPGDESSHAGFLSLRKFV